MTNFTLFDNTTSRPEPIVRTVYAGDDYDTAEGIARGLQAGGSRVIAAHWFGSHYVYLFTGLTEPEVDEWMDAEWGRLRSKLPEGFQRADIALAAAVTNVTPEAETTEAVTERVHAGSSAHTVYAGTDADYAEAIAGYLQRGGARYVEANWFGTHYVYLFIGLTEAEVDDWMNAETDRLHALPSTASNIVPAKVAPGTFAEVVERARGDARGMTLLSPGEPFYEHQSPDRRYPATDEAAERVRLATDLYEWDGHQPGRRRYFAEFTDDAIDLAFSHLVGDWAGTAIANMLTIGDGLIMVGRGVFTHARYDGGSLVYTPRPIFGA